MGKKIFWIFFSTVALISFLIVSYIQSDYFAGRIKYRLNSVLKNEAGIEVTFTNLSLKAFPPGVSLVNPEVTVLREDNKFELPQDAILKAREIGVIFRMIQTFAKEIVINVVTLDDARISVDLSRKKFDVSGTEQSQSQNIFDFLSRPIKLSLTDDISILIRQFEVNNSLLRVKFKGQKQKISEVSIDNIKHFSVKPSGTNYSVVFDLVDILVNVDDIKETLSLLKTNFEISKNLVQINSLDVKESENIAHISGNMSGDIRSIEKMQNDLKIIARSTSDGIDRFVPGFYRTRGNWRLEGKLTGSVKEPTFNGEVDIKDFRYKSWSFEKLRTEVLINRRQASLENLRLDHAGGALELDRLVADFGKKIISGRSRMNLLNLDLRQYIGDFGKKIANVEGVFDGAIIFDYQFAIKKDDLTIEKVLVEPNLNVRNFELNNRKFTEPDRKLVRILTKDQLSLTAELAYENGKLQIKDSEVKLDEASVRFSGGYSRKTGLLINAETKGADIGSELQQIAEIPVTGQGDVKLQVTDPGDRLKLDFTIDTQNTEFLDIYFGDAQGRIVYDDVADKIFIRKMQGKIDHSVFSGNGFIELGGKETIGIDVEFNRVQPSDIHFGFKKLITRFPWIPNDVTGWVTGSAKIFGSYRDMNRTFNVKGRVEGKRLFYKGEIFTGLFTRFEYIDGNYFFPEILLKKYSSVATGNFSFNRDEEMSYEIKIGKGSLRDFNFLSSANFPLDGNYRLFSFGSGKFGKLKTKFTMDLFNAHIRTRSVDPFKFRANSENGIFNLKALYRKAVIDLVYSYNVATGKDQSSLSVDSAREDFSFFLCLLNAEICENDSPFFRPPVDIQTSWRGENWQYMTGKMLVDPFKIGTNEKFFEFKQGLVATIDNGRMVIGPTKVEGSKTDFTLSAAGKIDGTSYKTSVKGLMHFGLIELLVPEMQNVDGVLNVDLSFFGSVVDSNISGKVQLSEGQFQFLGLNSRAQEVAGLVVFNKNTGIIKRLDGKLGGGSVVGTGNANIYLNRLPEFNFAIEMKNNRAQFFPVQFAEIEKARFTFTGNKVPYLLKGQVDIRKASVTQNFDVDTTSRKRRYARYLPKETSNVKKFYEIDILSTAQNGIFVQNDLLDAEFKGSLRLLNNFSFPQITGELELVSGKALFRYNSFDLDYAIMRLPDPENFEPEFSVSGESTLDGYKIKIFANGTTAEPKINFSSSPPLPQEDILSLLAFGYRGNDRRSINPQQASDITYTNFGALILDSLKINKNLQSQGLNVNVTPHVSDNPANSLRASPQQSSTVSPKVTVRKKISEKIDATASSTFGSEQSENIDLNLEYHLKDGVSVQGVYETEPGPERDEVRSSVGADIKFRWEFK